MKPTADHSAIQPPVTTIRCRENGPLVIELPHDEQDRPLAAIRVNDHLGQAFNSRGRSGPWHCAAVAIQPPDRFVTARIATVVSSRGKLRRPTQTWQDSQKLTAKTVHQRGARLILLNRVALPFTENLPLEGIEPFPDGFSGPQVCPTIWTCLQDIGNF